jgi:hypothetical protein
MGEEMGRWGDGEIGGNRGNQRRALNFEFDL